MTAEHSSEEGGEGLSEAEVNALDNAVLSSEWRAWVGTVERIIADRLAAVQVEADIAGQMKHITADMVRGDQPLEAKEEMIADLRARLSHTEAERDEAHENGYQRGLTEGREQAETRDLDYDALTDERDDLRGRLAAVERAVGMQGYRFCSRECHGEALGIIRAALANPSAAQGEGEVAARVLREAAYGLPRERHRGKRNDPATLASVARYLTDRADSLTTPAPEADQ